MEDVIAAAVASAASADVASAWVALGRWSSSWSCAEAAEAAEASAEAAPSGASIGRRETGPGRGWPERADPAASPEAEADVACAERTGRTRGGIGRGPG